MIRGPVPLAAVALIAFGGSGCYQYHVAPCTARPLTVAEAVADRPPAPVCEQPQWDPATEWETETAHSLVWGLARSPEYVFTTVCPAQTSIDQVRVHDNFGYALITVVTAGIWSPKRISYTCTKRAPAGDGSPESRGGTSS